MPQVVIGRDVVGAPAIEVGDFADAPLNARWLQRPVAEGQFESLPGVEVAYRVGKHGLEGELGGPDHQ